MIFIENMCVVALIPTIITISDSTFYPLLVILFISGWYFSFFVVIVFGENLSLQYVNLMNCILRLLSWTTGGLISMIVLYTYDVWFKFFITITSLMSTCTWK